MKKLLLGLLLLAGTAEAQLVTPPTTPGAGSIPSSSLAFPLAAPCGSLTAPTYAIGNAEMGLWCTAVDGTLLLQNRDTTPDAAGRSRLTLGVENFTLNATRSEAATHTGAVQCFDEGGSAPICRFDMFDGTDTGTFKFYPTFADFNKPVRAAPGGCATAAYGFAGETDSGMCLTSVGGSVTVSNGQFGTAASSGMFAGAAQGGFGFYDAGSLFTGIRTSDAVMYVDIDGTTIGAFAPAALSFGGARLYIGDGTSGSPGIQFSTDADTGFYHTTDVVGITAGSNINLRVTSLGVDFEDPGIKPTCDSTTRGRVFLNEGGAGVSDTFEVCRKDNADVYAWVSLF